MPDVQITRTAIIIVDTVSEDSYKNLLWTDKEGKKYKIDAKRRQHFDQIIIPNMGVQLNYTPNTHKPGTDFIYSAIRVKDMIPKPVKATPVPLPSEVKREITKAYQEATTKPAPEAPQDKSTPFTEWIKQKSIERQKALELAVNISIEISKTLPVDSTDCIKIAKIFESYLEKGV